MWKALYSQHVEEIVEHVYVARTDRENPVLSDEHDAWRWGGLEESVELLDRPENPRR